jgi:hypothetical protein
MLALHLLFSATHFNQDRLTIVTNGHEPLSFSPFRPMVAEEALELSEARPGLESDVLALGGTSKLLRISLTRHMY